MTSSTSYKQRANTTTVVTATPSTVSSSAAAATTDGLLVGYVVASPASVYSVPLSCPDIDGQNFTTKQHQTYVISCTEDENGGDTGIIIAYTSNDCIEACSAQNAIQNNATACVAVQFDSRMAYWNAASRVGYGNCWLKTATATFGSHTDGGMSARLVQS